jgi:hypothetical protein
MSGPSGLDAGHRGPLARRMLARTYEGRRDLLDGGGEPAGSVTQSRARSRPAGAATRPGGRQSAGSPRRPMTASPAPTPAGATRGAGRSWPAGHRRPAPGAAGAKTPAPRRVPGNLRHLEPPTMSPSRKARVTGWGGDRQQGALEAVEPGRAVASGARLARGRHLTMGAGRGDDQRDARTARPRRPQPDYLAHMRRTFRPADLSQCHQRRGNATQAASTTSETDLSPAAEPLSIPTRTHSPRRRS